MEWRGDRSTYRRDELAEGTTDQPELCKRQLGLWGGDVTSLCVPCVRHCWRGGKERPVL